MNSCFPTKPSRPVSLQPDIAVPANNAFLSAGEIAQAVTARRISAVSAIEAALARIAEHDPVLNSFTDVTADRARAQSFGHQPFGALQSEIVERELDHAAANLGAGRQNVHTHPTCHHRAKTR